MQSALTILVCALLTQAEQADPLALLRKAIAEHERGNLPRAIETYRQALEIRPQLTRARVNLSAALAATGRLDEAIAVLENAPAKDRGLAEVRLNLALGYHRKNELVRAIAELETLRRDSPTDLRVVNLLGDCYLRTGAAAKALAVVEPAAKAHPENVDLAYQYGMVLVRAGHPDRSLDPLEFAARSANSADAYLMAGANALEIGQMQRGKADLENAVRLNPKIPGVWSWVGLARDRVSDEDGAKEAYKKALEVDARDFEANLHLGAILYRERDLEEAKPYLEKAFELNPSSPLALYAIALVRAATNEIDRAIKDLETLVNTSPDWVEPHVKLASLYFRLNRNEDGRREREIVDKLKNENREQKIAFPELEAR
jgi:tetratricopeptide (TPR) repeat protein